MRCSRSSRREPPTGMAQSEKRRRSVRRPEIGTWEPCAGKSQETSNIRFRGAACNQERGTRGAGCDLSVSLRRCTDGSGKGDDHGRQITEIETTRPEKARCGDREGHGSGQGEARRAESVSTARYEGEELGSAYDDHQQDPSPAPRSTFRQQDVTSRSGKNRTDLTQGR